MENNNQTTMSFSEYFKEVEKQNEYLLSEMEKYPKNSQMYKLRWIQYKSNIIDIKHNLAYGSVLTGQTIN